MSAFNRHFIQNEVGENRIIYRLPGGIQLKRMMIRRCIIESSHYHVNSSLGNTFELEEGGAALTVTIPEGNYSITSFATAVATALNTAGANTYTVAGNLDTAKLTVTRTAGALAWRLLFASFSRMAHITGFSGDGVAGAGPFTADNPVWLAPGWVFLVCPQLARAGGTMAANHIVASIPVAPSGEGLFGSDVITGRLESDGFVIEGYALEELEFYLVDPDRGVEPLELNGGRFCVELWGIASSRF